MADTLRTNVAGTQAAFYRERGQEYPIVVRLRPEDREHVSDVDDVLVSAPGDRVVPARSLLTVEPGNSPVEIERKNQERISRVNAELEVSLSRRGGQRREATAGARRARRLLGRLRRRARGADQGLHPVEATC